VANRKIFVAHASAEVVNQALATRNLREGATRGARDGAAVHRGAPGMT